MRVFPIQPRTTEGSLTADQLAERYLSTVYHYLWRRLPVGERGDADDLTAQVFAAALPQLHRLAPGRDPLPWLLGIARRERINRERRQRYRRTESLEGLALANTTTPEKTALNQERRAQLWKILDALTPDQREALLLQHLEELSIAQIAHVLRKSHAATNSLLQRARQRALQLGGAYFFNEEELS